MIAGAGCYDSTNFNATNGTCVLQDVISGRVLVTDCEGERSLYYAKLDFGPRLIRRVGNLAGVLEALGPKSGAATLRHAPRLLLNSDGAHSNAGNAG